MKIVNAIVNFVVAVLYNEGYEHSHKESNRSN